MNESFWTDDRAEELRRLHDLGCSAAEIARMLGQVTRSAVIGKIHRLGIQKGRHTRRAARAWARLRQGAPVATPPRPFQRAQVVVESPAPMSFLDLPDHGCCRWPVNAEGAPFLYCANPCDEDRSYCDGHHEVSINVEKTAELRGQLAQQQREWARRRVERAGLRRTGAWR